MSRDFAVARRRMVDDQLRAEGITDERVLRAMRDVPRHRFVPRVLQHRAYEPCALPIGYGQTISQPFMVGLMTALLELRGAERILEVGTGSGYQAAILSLLAREVVTVERILPLARRAATLLADLGRANVQVLPADGTQDMAGTGLYDGVMITACAVDLPAGLADLLTDGGLLLVPITRETGNQILYRYQRQGHRLTVQESVACRFVPLRSGVEEA